jgi:hypothetical protein
MSLYTYDSTGQLWKIDVAPGGGSETITSVASPGGSASGPAPTITANDLITSSLRLIGAVASGETPPTAELADGLMVLNHMMSTWNAESQMIFTNGNYQEFALTVGKQSYTLGPGGDWNTARPARIERMGFVSLANAAQPLEIPISMMTQDQWAQVPVKLISNTMLLAVYDDGGFPSRTLYFRYIPTIAANVRVYSWTALSYFADGTTTYSFPEGYYEALRYNLAVRLAPEFGMSAAAQAQLAVVVPLAIEARAVIKRMNTNPLDLKCDAAVVGTSGSQRAYNWLTDNAGRN